MKSVTPSSSYIGTNSERIAMSPVPDGSTFFCTDTDTMWVYSSLKSSWVEISGTSSPTSPGGWNPYSLPTHWSPSAAFTTTLTLPANGGSIAIPFEVNSKLKVISCSVRNTNTSVERAWCWDVYVQDTNLGDASENTLRRVLRGTQEIFTPSVASTRTSLVVGGVPVVLDPGVYWVVIQCQNSAGFGLGSTASSSAFALSTAQTKTTSVPNGDTLDFVGGTWSKVTGIYAVRLNGVVFGQSVAF